VNMPTVKYLPLQQHLQGAEADFWEATFGEVESVLGFPLPNSARAHCEWWANNPHRHSHAYAWLDAGWLTRDVNLHAGTVTFYRTELARSSA